MSLIRMLPPLLAIALIVPRAYAQEDKAACRKAFEQAQTLRDEGKLSAAREQMLMCSRVCPAGFAKLCDTWVLDVEKALPTIVIRAVDEDGQDLSNTEATLDGKNVKLDGKSVAIDPGAHALKLSAPTRPPIEKEIVVAQGEKNRVIVVTIPSEKKKAVPPPARVESSPPTAAYVVTGIGIAALGGFAYFGLSADARHRELVNGCSKTASCSADDRDRVIRDWRIADAFLVSSVVLVGVGAYLYLSHDRTTVSVAPTASGARAVLTVTF
jgi:hypothetical protein